MKEKSRFVIKRTENELLIRSLHDQTFPEDEFYESEHLRTFWVVWLKGEPVGFCILSKWDDDYAFLARAGLVEKVRGQGLHKKMIKVRENFAKQQGFQSIMTYTKIDNINSSRNLQKSGYYLYLPEYQYADADCLYWIKELQLIK